MRSPDDLRAWAHEHLVYEAKMLVYACDKTADPTLSGKDRNAFIESFAIHLRCLREFLWFDRRGAYPDDARAGDFCAPGAWERGRPQLPEAIAAIEAKERNRVGREIVHLTYHRLDIAAETKGWPMADLREAIVAALRRFAELAEPDRLTDATRQCLSSLQPRHDAKRLDVSWVPISGATQPVQPRVGPGTIAFPEHSATDAVR